MNITFFVGTRVFTWNLYFKMIVTKNVMEKKKVMMLSGESTEISP